MGSEMCIRDRFNWAGCIAKELNINTIHNEAIGAGSNHRIIRTTLAYVKRLTPAQRTKTLVVIGWTDPNRNELYLDDKQTPPQWRKFNLTQQFSTMEWQNINPEFITRIDKFQELYAVDVHSYYASIAKFFEQSYMLAMTLENLGIKYYFFNTFPIFWGLHEPEHTNTIMKFRQEIQDYHRLNVHPVGETFINCIGHNKELTLPSDIHHPNVLGHALWASIILAPLKETNSL